MGERTMPVALTIAGSDSGGGAGIQADLKTFSALDVFGTSAITCVTAQNPDEVRGVEAVDPKMVALQVETVCAGFPVGAAKTGMLYSAEIIRAVAGAVESCGLDKLVVDPVMVSTSGARLLREDAVVALRDELIPRALVLTPNLPEAEILCGHAITTLGELRAAAQELSETFGTACALKGGHLDDPETSGRVVDVLSTGGEAIAMEAPRVDGRETHGTGCTFAAAVTALLARGEPLADAVAGAQRFVGAALAGACRVGTHYPLAWGGEASPGRRRALPPKA